MALLFMDGVAHYSNVAQKWNSTSGGPSIASGPPGVKALSLSGGSGGQSVSKSIASTSEVIVGCRIKYNIIPNGDRGIIRLQESSAIHLDVRIAATGQLRVTRNGTTLATGTTALTAGSIYYIELRGLINDSTGQYELRINGVTEVSGTSADTRNGGTGIVDTVVFHTGVDNGSINLLVSDIYICNAAGSLNNTFLGDVKVETLYPTGAGTTTNFTPSAGSNYQNVDDVTPDGDSTYNTDATAGDKDTFAMGDLATTAGSVLAVQQIVCCRKDDAGSRTLHTVMRSGGTDYEGGDTAVGDSYANVFGLRETNPATSAAFTISDVNGMEAGYKVEA